MGLVSKTTISGSDSFPEPQEYEITLKIKVTKYDGNGLHPAVGAMMNRILHDWQDGRHPFFVEQMHAGLEAVFKNAVYTAIQRDCREVYGNEMVELSERHTKARWAIEADKCMEEFDMPYINDSWNAKVERVWTEEEHQAFRDAINKTDAELAS